MTRCLLCCLLLLSFLPRLSAVEATVYLSNGQSLFGRVTTNRPIEFQDIFHNQFVAIPLSQIFRLFLVEEAAMFCSPWSNGEQEQQEAVEKRYLMSVITWNGKQHWGRFDCRVTVHEKYQKQRHFFITPIQVARNLKLHELYYVKEIVFQNAQPEAVGKLQWMSLAGKVKSAYRFHHIFAAHQQLGIVFAGSFDMSGENYQIPDIAPGIYDLFLVGDKQVLFATSVPQRRHWYDIETREDNPVFRHWLTGQAPATSLKVLHQWGRQSDTRALVGEEKQIVEYGEAKKQKSLWLCFCFYHHERWQIRNFQLLYQDDRQIPLPILLFDPRLSDVTIPLDTSGKRRLDYVWE